MREILGMPRARFVIPAPSYRVGQRRLPSGEHEGNLQQHLQEAPNEIYRWGAWSWGIDRELTPEAT